jgi:hypothetical protein
MSINVIIIQSLDKKQWQQLNSSEMNSLPEVNTLHSFNTIVPLCVPPFAKFVEGVVHQLLHFC